LDKVEAVAVQKKGCGAKVMVAVQEKGVVQSEGKK